MGAKTFFQANAQHEAVTIVARALSARTCWYALTSGPDSLEVDANGATADEQPTTVGLRPARQSPTAQERERRRPSLRLRSSFPRLSIPKMSFGVLGAPRADVARKRSMREAELADGFDVELAPFFDWYADGTRPA